MALAALVALILLVNDAAAQARLWRADDRLLISRFLDVGGLALDGRRVYAASMNGLQVYDFVARRWELPVTVEDGYPAGEGPTALSYDRSAGALWMATRAGSLYSYTLAFGRWERRATLGALTNEIVLTDEDPGSLFLGGPQGWRRVRAGSVFEDALTPAQIPESVRRVIATSGSRLLQSDPYFAAARGTIARDAQLRQWPVSAIAPAETRGSYWLGTAGGNVALFDGRTLGTDWLSFGVTTTGVSAVAVRADTLWFGGDGRDARSGITRTDRTLQSWRTYEGAAERAPRGLVYDIHPGVEGTWTWAAASDGLYLFAQGSWQRLDGILDGPVYSVTPGSRGVWVGARSGLAHIVPDEAEKRGVAGIPVYRAVEEAGVLLVATERGLWRIDATALDDPDAREPLLTTRIVDVAPAYGAMFALAEDALYRIESGRAPTVLHEPAQRIGRLYALAVSGNRLFVAGNAGLAAYDESTHAWTWYSIPSDIPAGPVRDVAVDGEFIWLATPAGALRLPVR
jgi:ligand-binding sensor domain-containing protein